MDIHNAEDKKLPVFIMCSDEGRDDCQQLKAKGSHASLVTTVVAVTILLMLSIVFSRVTVNILVFVLRVVFFVTRYMGYDTWHRDFALSASFVSELECFDGSEVRGKVNDSIVQKQHCVVEEIIEVELRSRRGKFIYDRTYNSVGLNKVSHFSRRGRANSRLPMKKIKSLLQKTRKVRVFVKKGIRKNTPLSSKIHCYVQNTNGLDLNRYRSNCNSVRFLLKGQLQN